MRKESNEQEKHKIGKKAIVWVTITLLCSILCYWYVFLQPKMEPLDLEGEWSPSSNEIVYICYKRERVITKIDWAHIYPGPYGVKGASKLREICITDVHRTSRFQLTNDSFLDYDPSWSPDGMKIVFVSERETIADKSHIFVIKKEGTGLTKITTEEKDYRSPKWSPQGGYIAVIERFEGDIYLLRESGSEFRRLTKMGHIINFEWSPDGNSLVFESRTEDGWEVFIVSVNSGDITRLTNNKVDDSSPTWSLNGKHVAYNSLGNIYVIEVSTGKTKYVLNADKIYIRASWQPGTNNLSFYSKDSGEELIITNLDNMNSHFYVFGHINTNRKPLWSTDGRYVMFNQFEDWNADGFSESKIWILDTNTGEDWTISSWDE